MEQNVVKSRQSTAAGFIYVWSSSYAMCVRQRECTSVCVCVCVRSRARVCDCVCVVSILKRRFHALTYVALSDFFTSRVIE